MKKLMLAVCIIAVSLFAQSEKEANQIPELTISELVYEAVFLDKDQYLGIDGFDSELETTGYIQVPHWEFIVIGEDTLFNDSEKRITIKYYTPEELK